MGYPWCGSDREREAVAGQSLMICVGLGGEVGRGDRRPRYEQKMRLRIGSIGPQRGVVIRPDGIEKLLMMRSILDKIVHGLVGSKRKR